MTVGSILDSILNAILGAGKTPLTDAELDAKQSKLAAANPQRLNWRTSIVDLLKNNGLDSSMDARKKLAQELGYTGDYTGTAEQNIWLHGRVMDRLKQ